VRWYLTPVRIAIIKKTKDKSWPECRQKWTLILCWGEFNLVQSLRTNAWMFLQKLKIELLYDPATPLPGLYPKEMKSVFWIGTCTPVYCTTIHNSEEMETTYVSINWWMDFLNTECIYIHIYNEILFIHMKEWNPTICKGWRELEIITLREKNQAPKDEYYMISLMCRI
jgi:hypothetical protein